MSVLKGSLESGTDRNFSRCSGRHVARGGAG